MRRRTQVAAGTVLIALLAAAAVPGSVGSQGPSPVEPLDATLFREVGVPANDGTAATTFALDPAHDAAGGMPGGSVIVDPYEGPRETGRPDAGAVQPDPVVRTIAVPRPTSKPARKAIPQAPRARTSTPRTASPAPSGGGSWNRDAEVSWYGPGFYGRRTACGYALTTALLGVAHRSLPCGTRITFRNPANGRTVTARVVDRGPYVAGRQWDLTGGLCVALGHCYTGPILWRRA